MTLNSLQYADDLIIFANTHETTQKHLNALSQYCDNWGLQINQIKTKYMGVQPKENTNLKINATVLEKVSSYK